MLAPSINPHQLDGLSLAESFDRCVLKDPDVVSWSALMSQRGEAYSRVFNEGQYPGPFIKYAWPIDVSARDLAYQFVKPVMRFIDEQSPTIPENILEIGKILSDRIKSFRQLLTSGRLVARGTFAMTGSITEVDRLQWARSGLLIDVRNSDLLELVQNRPVVKWSGLTLHIPAAAAIPKGRLERAKSVTAGRHRAHQASIGEAISSLWPKGIPKSIQIKVRDQRIIEWQRKRKRAVSNPKTIARYFMER